MVNVEPVESDDSDHDLAQIDRQIHYNSGNVHDIKELQRQDRFCRTILDYLTTGNLPDNTQDARLTIAIADDSRVYNGKLYKIKLNSGSTLQATNS